MLAGRPAPLSPCPSTPVSALRRLPWEA
jgi:hypothetical protein